MTVVRSDPPTATAPGVGVYRKTGPVLLGEATVHVRPTGPASCTLIWTEAVHLRGLPRALTAPLLRPFTAAMLRHALRAIRAELA
jgi:carbon monoxide dehydrogenase subunit G